MKRLLLILFLLLRTSLLASPSPAEPPSRERLARILASRNLSSFYSRNKSKVDTHIILTIMETAETELPKYFPNGEIDVVDMLTIASCESGYYPKARGKAGEVGLFQILHPMAALIALGIPKADPYDPAVNTRMGIYILSEKFKLYRTRKRAIIAYNGIAGSIRGKWDETYWRYFLTRRAHIASVVEDAKKRHLEVD